MITKKNSLYVIAFLLFIFATNREITDSKDSYRNGLPSVNDTDSELIEKAIVCGNYSQRTVYWRRAYITSILITILICYFMNWPKEPNDIAIMFVLIYIGIYAMLLYFRNTYEKGASNCLKNCLSNLSTINLN